MSILFFIKTRAEYKHIVLLYKQLNVGWYKVVMTRILKWTVRKIKLFFFLWHHHTTTVLFDAIIYCLLLFFLAVSDCVCVTMVRVLVNNTLQTEQQITSLRHWQQTQHEQHRQQVNHTYMHLFVHSLIYSCIHLFFLILLIVIFIMLAMDPELAGGILYPTWGMTACGSPKRSWKIFAWNIQISHHSPIPERWETMNEWMDGWMVGCNITFRCSSISSNVGILCGYMRLKCDADGPSFGQEEYTYRDWTILCKPKRWLHIKTPVAHQFLKYSDHATFQVT